MHDLLILAPWVGAALAAFLLRRALAARVRDIAAWWGLPLSGQRHPAYGRGREPAEHTSEQELEELRRRYAQAPEDTRAAVMRLLAR